ncbi:Histidine--tRNA ligase [uncultured archaeon]|nr:Histidine--tRNA ligase [uncultured archaeon]
MPFKKLPHGLQDYGFKETFFLKNLEANFRRQCILANYAEIDSSTLDYYDNLTLKYAGGEEIVKELYSLKDQGDRKLGLRFDLTIPTARFFSESQYSLPFKRFQVGKVYRDGPVKKGRLREFYQFDVDVYGISGLSAELEILSILSKVLEELKIDFIIKINHRKFLDLVITKITGLKETEEILLTLDKLEKQGKEKVIEELLRKNITKKNAMALLDLLSDKKVLTDKRFKGEGSEELNELIKLCKNQKIPVVFLPTLSRGLNYYSGIIFEIYSSNFDSSIGSGGRYDGMLKNLCGRDFPAVGGSIGATALLSACELIDPKKGVLVFDFGTKRLISQIYKLKDAGIPADYSNHSSISKALDYANKNNYSYVLIQGDKDLEKKVFTLKNLSTGKDQTINEKEIIKVILT